MVNLNIRRNVITNVVAFTINIILTFLSYRMVIDKGGVVALGVWSALSAAIFIIRLGDVGMGSSTERYVAMVDVKQAPEKLRGYLDTAIIINSVLFFILAILGWFILSFCIEWIIPKDKNLQLEALDLLPLMLVVFVLSNISSVIISGLRGLHLAYKAAYLSIGGSLLQMLTILIFVPKLGIAGLAWGQFVQNIFIALVAWFFFNKQIKQYGIACIWLPILGSKIFFRELLGFSLKAQAVNLVNGLFEPLSKFFIGHSSGMATLGLYEIAYKIVATIRGGVVSGVLGIMPAITHLLVSNHFEAQRLYFQAKNKAKKISIIAMLMVAFVSPVFSIAFLDSLNTNLILFIIILTVGCGFNAISSPAYTLGFSSGKLMGNLLAAVITIFILGFCYFLKDEISILSPVILTSFSMVVGSIVVIYVNEKILKEV